VFARLAMACSAAMSVEELWEQQRAADGTGGVGEQSEATEATTATATTRGGGADGQSMPHLLQVRKVSGHLLHASNV
jgi:hypothetical protein